MIISILSCKYCNYDFFSIKLSFSEQIFSEFVFLFFLKQRTYKHNIPDFEMNFKHDFGN